MATEPPDKHLVTWKMRWLSPAAIEAMEEEIKWYRQQRWLERTHKWLKEGRHGN